ncbi:conjugal transfer protein TraF [Streptococcus sp. DD13]|uniref:conjugal transfer protein TraF n=1 Tax=Streptococcus sp. DD13 TaxID=1777881 RepID=UPI0007972C30|nr:conjugal transfer protein TraF [Streptococcus sp. DD13]KXT77725.1 Bacterocin transport accessory protein [Streptococcus sp. DD13]
MAFTDVFHEVTPQQAEQFLAAQEGAILFIGRETCPYCQRFAPKLAQVASQEGWTVYYLNSASTTDAEKIQALRSQYQVPTVPGFLYASPAGVKVRCDSGMSPEAILDFVQG